jgi:serine/threonine protein kinase
LIKPCLTTLLRRVQPNILVDHTGQARITDFGLATVTQNLESIRTASGEQGYTARWTAPEILNEEGTYSKEADVFSFAMVMIEVRHRWVFSSGLTSLPSRIITGVHRCCSFPSKQCNSGCFSHYEGHAPSASNAPKVHERSVEIDAALLGPKPSLTSGGFEHIERSGHRVSPLSFLFRGHTPVKLSAFV